MSRRSSRGKPKSAPPAPRNAAETALAYFSAMAGAKEPFCVDQQLFTSHWNFALSDHDRCDWSADELGTILRAAANAVKYAGKRHAEPLMGKQRDVRRWMDPLLSLWIKSAQWRMPTTQAEAEGNGQSRFNIHGLVGLRSSLADLKIYIGRDHPFGAALENAILLGIDKAQPRDLVGVFHSCARLAEAPAIELAKAMAVKAPLHLPMMATGQRAAVAWSCAVLTAMQPEQREVFAPVIQDMQLHHVADITDPMQRREVQEAGMFFGHPQRWEYVAPRSPVCSELRGFLSRVFSNANIGAVRAHGVDPRAAFAIDGHAGFRTVFVSMPASNRFLHCLDGRWRLDGGVMLDAAVLCASNPNTAALVCTVPTNRLVPDAISNALQKIKLAPITYALVADQTRLRTRKLTADVMNPPARL